MIELRHIVVVVLVLVTLCPGEAWLHTRPRLINFVLLYYCFHYYGHQPGLFTLFVIRSLLPFQCLLYFFLRGNRQTLLFMIQLSYTFNTVKHVMAAIHLSSLKVDYLRRRRHTTFSISFPRSFINLSLV